MILARGRNKKKKALAAFFLRIRGGDCYQPGFWMIPSPSMILEVEYQ